jgi:hypothetical protein
MTYEVKGDKVELFFMSTSGPDPRGGPSKVTNPQKAYFVNKKRKFFAISDAEREKIIEMTREHVNELLSRQGGQ